MQNTPDVHFKVQMNNLQRSNMFLGGQEELKITYPFSYIAVLQKHFVTCISAIVKPHFCKQNAHP